jgi:hypothetical protein
MVDTSISPYNDDYDSEKNFHQVLFKPGRAVQVRELNQLQTLLQNQVSRLGDHLFENGSMVIPGEINYNLEYEYLTVTNIDYSAISQTLETNEVVITGLTSGVSATIVQHLANTGTDPVTFYLQYESSSSGGDLRFTPGETVQLTTSLGVDVDTATAVSTGQGSVVTIEAGIFYLNGSFIRSDAQRIVLSKYSNTPSAVAGFRLVESIVDWTQDSSLLDNAGGSTNANAIGADRLKKVLQLETYSLGESFDKENFIELIRFDNGVLQKKVRSADYSVLEDTLARRTFDESGDYTVSSFGIRVREHLLENNNDGLYEAPVGDSSKFVVGIEKGKAYVRGYEVENLATRYIEVDKARESAIINNAAFTLPVGNYIEVSALNVLPKSNTFQTITFYSGTPASPGSIPSGSVLGTARVRYTTYDFTDDLARIYLFDVKDATGASNSEFIDTAQSVYAAGSPAVTGIIESELIDSVNYGLVYALPITNVKSLLNAGVSDTSYSVTRQYEVTTDSSGNVVLTAGTNEVFAVPTQANSVASYVDTGASPVVADISGISTIGGTPSGKTLTIAFGAGAESVAVTINVEVVKQLGGNKSKTVTSNSIVKTAGSFTSNRFMLGKADVFEIVSIVEDGVDRTNAYRLVKNVTPELYGQSYIELKAGQGVPANDTTITYNYFVHGSGDFFSVDSYSSIAYEDIPTDSIGTTTVSLADVIDFRPRYNDAGTGFTGAGASVVEVPSPYTLLRNDIEHYLPRIDKVFVTSKGEFNVIKGVSSLTPNEPRTPDNAMVLYNLEVPAYTASVKDINIIFVNNRRYTMRDIGKLEDRIANIEYYVTLNQLESETNALQIVDPLTGLNRFKNGFITDNFIDHSVGAFTLSGYRCSVSREDATLRPEFGFDQVPFEFNESSSTGVVKTGDLVTLPYSEVSYLSQNLASGTMNINPYAVYLWAGDMSLTPSSDTWFDTVYTDPDVTYRVFNNGRLSQEWNSWGLNWTGGSSTTSQIRVTNARWNIRSRVTTTTNVEIDVTSDRVVDRSVVPFMRSREVAFSAKGLMPNTKVYAIFDNVDVTAYCKQDGKSFVDDMITDADGNLSGTFLIPNSDEIKFRTGTKQFTIIDNSNGTKSGALTYADAAYSANGTQVTRTQSIVATKQITERVQSIDPLAQSFLVDKNGGVFLTSVDVYFATKDDSVPVTIQIRNMVNGYPGQQILPYSSKTLKPSEVSTSTDASAVTKFTFDSPVYLVDGQEYCFVLLSNCNNYNAYIATMGSKQIGTNETISKQPFVGVMFKSQNNTTWSADQLSDIKFGINIADFVTNVQGNAVFNNTHPVAIDLGLNPLTSASGSNVITVELKDHGMVVGSKVTIAGVDVGPGIDISELNKVHDVSGIVDLDHFEVTVTTNATSTGSFGGSTVTCDKNFMMNTIQPVAQELLFENTNVDWVYRGTTGKSIDGTESPYNSIANIEITPNENNDLTVPYLIPSEVDANDKLVGSAAAMTANMVSYASNISPVIDVNGLGVIGITNRLNNPSVLDESGEGNAFARYLTNVVGLKNAANSLKVYVDVNKPQGSDVVIYYRTGNSIEETNEKSWSTLPAIVTTVSTDEFTFNEFEYEKIDIPLFSFYQFKIVMLSESSSVVPKLQRFRGLALGT